MSLPLLLLLCPLERLRSRLNENDNDNDNKRMCDNDKSRVGNWPKDTSALTLGRSFGGCLW